MAGPLYLTRTEYGYIGKRNLARKDSAAKAKGQALYTRDIVVPNMLHAKCLRSPYSHATMKTVDKTKAEKIAGVRLVISPFDPEVKDLKNYDRYTGAGPAFRFTAHYAGEPLGVFVVADTEAACEEALRAINIEWEQLPFILDYKEAAKANAPLVRPEANAKDNLRLDQLTEYGDAEKGLAAADSVLEYEMTAGENVVMGPEPGCVIARPDGDKTELWMHTQYPSLIERLAQFPKNKAVLHMPAQGGMFGAANSPDIQMNAGYFARYLSQRIQRPVRLALDHIGWDMQEEAFGYHKVKVGFKKDGTITAVDINTQGVGFTNEIWIRHSTGIQNLRKHRVDPFVNRPYSACYRHGAAYVAINTYILQKVADALSMDPTDVALKNDGSGGRTMQWLDENIKKTQGFPVVDSLKMCLEKGKALIEWDAKKHAPGAKKLANGKYHGLGFTYMDQWRSTMGFYLGPCGGSVGVGLATDGTAMIYGILCEMGQDNITPLCQIVADELGVKFDDVDMLYKEDVGLFPRPPASSSAMTANGTSVAKASRQLKKKVLEAATTGFTKFGSEYHLSVTDPPLFVGKTPKELEIKDGQIFEIANPSNSKPLKQLTSMVVSSVEGTNRPPLLFATASTEYPDTRGNEKEEMTNFSLPEAYDLPRQAHFMEVEVDPETGKVDVVNLVHVNDVGKAISPEGVEVQQESGAFQGVGRCISEDFYRDPATGVRLNEDLIGYPVLTMNDVAFPKTAILENGLGYGVYGSSGIGESAVACTTFLISAAVYNAIGKWIDPTVTPDKVLKALGKA